MSVGVILDETPSSCRDCQFNRDYDQCEAACKELEVDVDYELEFNGKAKPDWCPLQEVEPVRHGHWTDHVVEKVYNSVLYHECSECGYSDCDYPEMYPIRKYKYCPNCGAKMDGQSI